MEREIHMEHRRAGMRWGKEALRFLRVFPQFLSTDRGVVCRLPPPPGIATLRSVDKLLRYTAQNITGRAAR